MGTSFYMQDRQLAREIKHFEEKYPHIHVEIPRFYIGKTSAGWKPLFRTSLLYTSVKEIKKLYDSNGRLQIVDGEDNGCTWNEFVERVLEFGKKGKTHIGLDTENIKYVLDDDGYEFVIERGNNGN